MNSDNGLELPDLPVGQIPKVGEDGYNPFTDPESVWFGVSPDFRPRSDRPIPSFKCSHVNKKTHKRCGNWAVRGTGFNNTKAVCRKHGGSLPNVRAHADAIVEGARLALADSVPDAVAKLVRLATSDEAPHQVQLNAAKDILDRAGLKPGDKVEVDIGIGVEKPSEMIMKKITEMRKDEVEANVEEAEIVGEGE